MALMSEEAGVGVILTVITLQIIIRIRQHGKLPPG